MSGRRVVACALRALHLRCEMTGLPLLNPEKPSQWTDITRDKIENTSSVSFSIYHLSLYLSLSLTPSNPLFCTSFPSLKGNRDYGSILTRTVRRSRASAIASRLGFLLPQSASLCLPPGLFGESFRWRRDFDCRGRSELVGLVIMVSDRMIGLIRGVTINCLCCCAALMFNIMSFGLLKIFFMSFGSLLKGIGMSLSGCVDSSICRLISYSRLLNNSQQPIEGVENLDVRMLYC